MNSPLACQGLLEVQPLHFVCCSTSDGARVERGDTQQIPGGSLGPSGASMAVPMMSSGMPSSATLAPTLPTVSASLAALEKELQMLKVIKFHDQRSCQMDYLPFDQTSKILESDWLSTGPF